MLKKLGIITLSATALAGGFLPSVSHAFSTESEQTVEGINGDVSYDMSASDILREEVQIEAIETLESEGFLEVDEESQSVTITEAYKQAVLENLEPGYTANFTENSVEIVPTTQLRASTGVNKIVYTWKGIDLYLNNSTSNKVAGGSGVAAALSVFIPEPAVSKVLAAALGTIAGLITFNNNGKGVILAFLGDPRNGKVPVFHWISSQK